MSASALHTRIAETLGWDVRDVQSFSHQALREIVKDHPKLVHELDLAIRSGRYLLGEAKTARAR